jgi:plasmid maintenance system antidote protein VapI
LLGILTSFCIPRALRCRRFQIQGERRIVLEQRGISADTALRLAR